MTEPFEKNATSRISAALKTIPLIPVPRGEVWLGTELFKQAGLADTLENHFSMADRLGQDMVCLPITDNTIVKPSLGYRYFELSDLQTMRISDQFIAAVVDGPFQELVNGMGLMKVFINWARDPESIIKAYENEKTRLLGLISQCLDMGVQAIIITDDLAADQGPMIHPNDIEMLCTGFYREAVKRIHGAGLPVFLHSCGKLTQLAGLINTWQIDGLAAIQHSVNDLPELRNMLEPGCVIMAGIDSPLLVPEPSVAVISEFKRMLTTMASQGGFILCSSCGLYCGDYLDRIERIYALADCLPSNMP